MPDKVTISVTSDEEIMLSDDGYDLDTLELRRGHIILYRPALPEVFPGLLSVLTLRGLLAV